MQVILGVKFKLQLNCNFSIWKQIDVFLRYKIVISNILRSEAESSKISL